MSSTRAPISSLLTRQHICHHLEKLYRNTDGASAANVQVEALLESFAETIDEVLADLDQYFNALGTASAQAGTQATFTPNVSSRIART